MKTNFFAEYSRFEDGLIQKFHAHPLYQGFHALPFAQFVNYVLQISFIAQNFVKWYETAKLGMVSESAREIIRHILRDEIPSSGATHQDDRLYDLMLMGIGTERVRNVRPSAGTQKTIKRLYQLIRYPQENYDLRVLIALRVAGEVLVAEQYRHIVEYMEHRLGISPEQSRFYAPHYEHDLKGVKSRESAGHADSFDVLLKEMISDQQTLEIAKATAQAAFEARSGIHDQFVRKLRSPKLIAGGLAAAITVICILVFTNAGKPNWYNFLKSVDVQTRQFYLECDRQLIERVERSGNTEDLAKVGSLDRTSVV